MDATVNDFFNEIKQLASKSEPKGQSEVWHECFDEVTGYSYFWNTETDEVSWVPPKSYKRAENSQRKNASKAAVGKEKWPVELFVPPTTGNVCQYSMPEAKVYSIQDAIKEPEQIKKQPFPRKSSMTKPVNKRPFRKPEDSDDDEKIELITEYGEDSNSDTEDKSTQSVLDQRDTFVATSPTIKKASPKSLPEQNARVEGSVMPKQGENQSDEEDDDDDFDILAKIQQRAQELKKLGGKVPSSVKQIIQKTEVNDKPEKSTISGFSLVAGYNSDSESETELHKTPPPKPIFPLASPPNSISETSHSTLFPITKPIDLKDFIGSESPASETAKETIINKVESADFDNKAFQRKRRIGVSLVNNVKRPKEDVLPGTDFAGLGFKSENVNSADIKTDKEDAPVAYPGFQKGGVRFVKSDILNPTAIQDTPASKEENQCSLSKKQAEDDYTGLREKLLFLGEGRGLVLPVQVMLIQAETLFEAMKEGGLNLSYLHKWLSETCSDLIKLEKEAAPEGWLLQWDRSHKRYFYQNQTTGVNQWRYPEPDVTRCDDAMDISTTPPPPDIKDEPPVFGPQLPSDPPLPPSPPNIRSPTPPPPPMISLKAADIDLPPILSDQHQSTEILIHQPVLPGFDNGQPLPPGVDLVTNIKNKKVPEVGQKAPDTLITALDSFYSEIAEVSENTNSLSPISAQVPETVLDPSADFPNQKQSSEAVKKKKKKVKLAQGLTMKKKGVSQLVEKWKNVQKTYGD